MKKILLSILTLGIGAFALNAQTLDQSNTASVGSGWVVNSGAYTSNGQSFTAGMTGFLHSISINIESTNTVYPILAGDFTLTIRDGNGYGGTILNIDTFTVTGSETSGWLNIPVKPNTVAITAGNSYTYIVDEISGTGQLNILASGNAYAGGDLYYQVFTNPATLDGTRDFIFETYVTTPNCTVDQQHIGTDTRQALIGSDAMLEGQSFRAGISGQLNSVDLDLIATNGGCAISNMNVKVEILNGDGLSGAVLASEIFSLSTNFPRTLTTFSFSNPASIVANQLYTITFSLVSGQSCGAGEPQLNWFYQFPSSFSGTGGMHYRGGVITSLGDAYYFKTCVGVNTCSVVDQTVTASQTTLCDSGAVTISTGSSETGVNYFLRNDADSSIVGGPVAGTGSGLTFNTGTINTTTTYNVYGVSPSNGLKFDGADDFVDAGTGVNLANSSFSVEFWAKKSVLSSGNDDHIVGLGDNTFTNEALHIGFRGGNQFTFAFFGNDLDAPSNLADTNWHHWAVTFDAVTNARTIYRDGIAVASDISSSDFLGTGTLKIGRAYNASINNFNGSLDEVRIWTIPRTQSEILANMYNCLTGSESGLSAYYQFENGSGSSTLSDVTSNGNTGTLTNMNVNTAWNSGVSVCSSCNLEMTQTVTITVNNSPTSSVVSQTNVSCNGGTNGSATVSATGGTAPYTYLWSNSATTATATGLAAGTYTVTITDANGCTSNVSSVTITEPTALTSSISSQTNVACNGANTGSATVSATGGTAPYTYLWSNGPTTTTTTGLVAGFYIITVTDANGCTSSQNVTITEPTALVSSITSQTNVSCNGGTDGSATATANGGTAPYTYLWSNAATTATATGLVAGSYNVTVTDANGCNSAQNVTISEPAAITGTDVQTACNSYTWIDNNTYTASNNTATHTIVGGAANGCDSIVTLNLTITTVDNSTTLNANTISANQNGATYRWLDCNNGNAVISGETAQSFTPTATGNYAVEISLGSCVDTSACTNVVITNIDEMGMKNINIYPNPTKDDINIELPLNELTSFDVSVYSVTGKLVYKNTQLNVNKLSISTANWDKGIYFIQLIGNNQAITEKIIKQ